MSSFSDGRPPANSFSNSRPPMQRFHFEKGCKNKMEIAELKIQEYMAVSLKINTAYPEPAAVFDAVTRRDCQCRGESSCRRHRRRWQLPVLPVAAPAEACTTIWLAV